MLSEREGDKQTGKQSSVFFSTLTLHLSQRPKTNWLQLPHYSSNLQEETSNLIRQLIDTLWSGIYLSTCSGQGWGLSCTNQLSSLSPEAIPKEQGLSGNHIPWTLTRLKLQLSFHFVCYFLDFNIEIVIYRVVIKCLSLAALPFSG